MGIKLDLRKWQRKYLSPFCLEECTETCCCREETVILMRESQFMRAYGIKPGQDLPPNPDFSNYYPVGLRRDNTMDFIVCIQSGAGQPHCPAYDPATRICKLESDKPAGCRDFPLEIHTPVILLDCRCNITEGENRVRRKLEQIAKEHSHKIELKITTAKAKDLVRYKGY